MEELEAMFDLKTDLLDYVLENGFHVAGYLKQKALLSIDDSASQKGKGKGRSAAAKEGQGSSKQADKENVRVSGNAMLQLLKYPRMCCIRNFTTAWWHGAMQKLPH